MKRDRQLNSGMLLKRTPIESADGPGLALCDEDFIRELSDGNIPACASRTSAAVSRPKPAIRIFVAYDSQFSRDRAAQIKEELSRRLGRSFAFSISSWKFKSLWHPKMLRMATAAAVNAEIIVFSLLAGGDMPQAVKNWLETGLVNTPGKRVCLLALLETGGALRPRSSPAEGYLSNLSSKMGVDYLCYSDSIPMSRFRRQIRQQGESHRGHGCVRRRLTTPSGRLRREGQVSNSNVIGINV